MQIKISLWVSILALFLLVGCGGGGKSAGIPDSKLRMEWRECKGLKNPSRLKNMACENYERECVRRKENGNRACY